MYLQKSLSRFYNPDPQLILDPCAPLVSASGATVVDPPASLALCLQLGSVERLANLQERHCQ